MLTYVYSVQPATVGLVGPTNASAQQVYTLPQLAFVVSPHKKVDAQYRERSDCSVVTSTDAKVPAVRERLINRRQSVNAKHQLFQQKN